MDSEGNIPGSSKNESNTQVSNELSENYSQILKNPKNSEGIDSSYAISQRNLENFQTSNMIECNYNNYNNNYYCFPNNTRGSYQNQKYSNSKFDSYYQTNSFNLPNQENSDQMQKYENDNSNYHYNKKFSGNKFYPQKKNNHYNNNYNSSYYGGYPKKKKAFTYNMRWDGYDPYTVKSMIYRAEVYIMSRYPSLAKINPSNEGFSKNITDNSRYFIIKSFNEEDVHKAIKYSLWSSTKAGNQTLNEAFRQTKEKGGFVYLFFSCNGSGRYIGVAKMLSEVNESKEFNYWTQDSKWPGLFDIEWIFIKDIPFKCFKIINIMMKDGMVKPLSNARDTQEIPFSESKIMLETFDNYTNTNSILEQFEYYDVRQENYEKAYL